MVKGLGWTVLTTLAGFLGLIFHALRTRFSSEIELNAVALIRDGSVMLFSATLVASVILDIYFEDKQYKGRRGNFLHIMLWFAGSNFFFSTACYLIILGTSENNFKYDEASKLTLGVLLTAVLTAIAIKSVTFSDQGGQR
jgi:hypothetical protein